MNILGRPIKDHVFAFIAIILLVSALIIIGIMIALI